MIQFEFSRDVPDINLLRWLESIIQVRFGPMTLEYLLEYGYIGLDSFDFYGVTGRQGVRSDMIKQTLYLHELDPQLRYLIAFESIGEGTYILTDCRDMMWRYDLMGNHVTHMGCDLQEYVAERLRNGD